MNASVAHIGIAVTSITDALAFYRDVLGLSPGRPETADGATIVSLHFGAVDVELLEPAHRISTSEDDERHSAGAD